MAFASASRHAVPESAATTQAMIATKSKVKSENCHLQRGCGDCACASGIYEYPLRLTTLRWQ